MQTPKKIALFSSDLHLSASFTSLSEDAKALSATELTRAREAFGRNCLPPPPGVDCGEDGCFDPVLNKCIQSSFRGIQLDSGEHALIERKD